MAYAPGKYDHIAGSARDQAKAVAALVVVIEGYAGNGFSIQTIDPIVLKILPALLRQVANEIDIQNNVR